MKVKKIAGIIFIIISITWGCNQSGSGEQESEATEEAPKEEQIQTLEQPETPAVEVDTSGEPDEYGRKPGDPHYGHNHPPQEGQQGNQVITPQDDQAATQEETPSGEPDKYGRNPGDEHYGHDHP